MAAPYNVQTYLLDKANIQDTMIRMVCKIPPFPPSPPLFPFVPPHSYRNSKSTLIPPKMFSIDTKASSTIINSVYASEVYLDYDPLLGGSPELISSEDWAKRLEQIHDPYDSTQHLIQ